eukprot:800433-Karenia_brevis.AAC.1
MANNVKNTTDRLLSSVLAFPFSVISCTAGGLQTWSCCHFCITICLVTQHDVCTPPHTCHIGAI